MSTTHALSRPPFEQQMMRPAELFMRFTWRLGRCLFCRRRGNVASIVDVLWDDQRMKFDACQACVFRIFAAFEARWWAGDDPPPYRNPGEFLAPIPPQSQSLCTDSERRLMTNDTTAATADELRDRMIHQLKELDAIRTPGVERAIRAVPRHLFVPEDSLERAYEPERAVVTKHDENGVSLSSVSAARIQAFMLEQAEAEYGMDVLEVGSGGVNAAYLDEIVGTTDGEDETREPGQVTTIDIDPEVIARAERLLRAAGYDRVRTLVADAAHGVPQHAPYQRIIVTVEAADLSTALVDELDQDNGRMVLPLRLRGLTRSMSFTWEDGHLVARDPELCGFVPMRGADAQQQTLLVLHNGEGKEVGLRLDGVDADGDALRAAFVQPRVEAWSGVTIASGTSYDPLDLWLATVCDGYSRLTATRAARHADLVGSWSPMGISAVIVGGKSFGYMALRPANEDRTEWEFGAIGHGPDAQEAAGLVVSETRVWHREHREQAPEIRAYRAGTPDAELAAGRVVDRRNFRFTISWPKSS